MKEKNQLRVQFIKINLVIMIELQCVCIALAVHIWYGMGTNIFRGFHRVHMIGRDAMRCVREKK